MNGLYPPNDNPSQMPSSGSTEATSSSPFPGTEDGYGFPRAQPYGVMAGTTSQMQGYEPEGSGTFGGYGRATMAMPGSDLQSDGTYSDEVGSVDQVEYNASFSRRGSKEIHGRRFNGRPLPLSRAFAPSGGIGGFKERLVEGGEDGDKVTPLPSPVNRRYTSPLLRNPSSSSTTNSPFTAAADAQALSSDPDLQFVHAAMMSNLAYWLLIKIPRIQKMKGTIEYPRSFTGRDVVNTLLPALPRRYGEDRKVALMVARSIQDHPLFIHEVDWEERKIKDNTEDVFMFREDDHYELGEPATPSGSTLSGNSFVGGFIGGNGVAGNGLAGGAMGADETDELPNAVITSLTGCYSSGCSGDAEQQKYACYSRTCPYNKSIGDLQRSASVLSTSSGHSAESSETAISWEFTVTPEFLETLERNTILRQCAIYELIHQEENLARDLHVFKDVIRGALLNADPPIIPPSTLPQFIQEVFLNIDEVVDQCDSFIEALHVRQKEEHPIVKSIGHIILDHALEWEKVYLKYNVGVPMAEQRVKEEVARNPAFATFVSGLSKLTKSKQSDIRHYQTRLSLRLPRYDLQLSEAVKRSSDDDPDKAKLEQAREIIKKQCMDMNALMNETELKVALREYAGSIMRKDDEDLGFDLGNPERKLFSRGDIVRKTEGALSEWVDLHAVLFDHYFVMTKPRDAGGKRRHFVSRQFPPCRLELLSVRQRDEEPTKRSIIHIGTLTGAIRPGNDGRNATHTRGETTERTVYPLILEYGNNTPPFAIYLPNEKVRDKWRKKLDEAIQKRVEFMKLNERVDTRVMTESEPPRPTCAVPFFLPGRGHLLAIGTHEGVSIGEPGSGKPFRQVLTLPSVTQLAILIEYNLLVVLAGKRLVSYKIEELIPSLDTGTVSKAGSHAINSKAEVAFFKIGKTTTKDGVKTLLVFAVKSGVSLTIYKSREPCKPGEKVKGAKGFFKGFKEQETFRDYKEWFVPTEGTSISFLRKMVAMSLPQKGIEIIMIDDLRATHSIPDFETSTLRNDGHAMRLRSRIGDSMALGMFRISDTEFLLCYADFAFYANTHGEPISRRTNPSSTRLSHVLDYEARCESVTYHSPYLICISTTLVQVFDVRTAESVQVIKGVDCCLLYDGLGVDADGGFREPGKDVERRVVLGIKKQREGGRWEVLEVARKGGF